jgi:hypothetical protein
MKTPTPIQIASPKGQRERRRKVTQKERPEIKVLLEELERWLVP